VPSLVGYEHLFDFHGHRIFLITGMLDVGHGQILLRQARAARRPPHLAAGVRSAGCARGGPGRGDCARACPELP